MNMDYGSLFNTLAGSATKLITLGGSVSPAVGSVVTLVVVGLLVYLGFKGKAQAWSQSKVDAGNAVNQSTGSNQQTSGNVANVSDNFFGDNKQK